MAERNHDVRETVLKVEFVDEARAVAARQYAVGRQRGLGFRKDAKVLLACRSALSRTRDSR